MKKKIPLPALLLTALLAFAPNQTARAGIPVTCANCSTVVQQILDSVTMANELVTAIHQYEELIVQTQQQIFMAQSEIKRLATLPGALVDKYSNLFTDMAEQMTNVNVYLGDVSALIDVYREAYPDFNVLYGLVNGENPNAVQEEWQARALRTEEVAKAAFLVSGSQLERLTKNQEAMRNHVQRLLAVQNETEIQQSANALSGIMLSELQDMNRMTALSMQHAVDQGLYRQQEDEINKFTLERDTRRRINFKADDPENKINNPY